jgi:hypothetical protein
MCSLGLIICDSVTINGIIRQNGGGGSGSSSDQIEIEIEYGSGDGGGEQKNSPTDYDSSDLWEIFLSENPGCSDAINDLAKKAGITGTLESVYNSIKWLSSTHLSESELKKIKLSEYGETSSTKNTSLYDIFYDKKYPADAVAIWTSEKPTVILNFTIGIIPKSRIVAHETLHILFKGNHVSVANKLGLGEFKNETDASRAINDFLKNNCGKERKNE